MPPGDPTDILARAGSARWRTACPRAPGVRRRDRRRLVEAESQPLAVLTQRAPDDPEPRDGAVDGLEPSLLRRSVWISNTSPCRHPTYSDAPLRASATGPADCWPGSRRCRWRIARGAPHRRRHRQTTRPSGRPRSPRARGTRRAWPALPRCPHRRHRQSHRPSRCPHRSPRTTSPSVTTQLAPTAEVDRAGRLRRPLPHRSMAISSSARSRPQHLQG